MSYQVIFAGDDNTNKLLSVYNRVILNTLSISGGYIYVHTAWFKISIECEYI